MTLSGDSKMEANKGEEEALAAPPDNVETAEERRRRLSDEAVEAAILEQTALMQPPSKMNPSAKFKKAPDAPKRFKSAFIIFSAEKHKEIKEELSGQGRSEKTTDIAKLVSEAWRELTPEEKEIWEKKARKDKARYEVEKAMYKGPWKVPANKRTPKDPTAPKRPMSAFLAFSNKRRAALKRQHQDATNADLSKMLSKTWREAPEELRRKYMDEEAELRAQYKIEMAKWRKKVAEEKKAERKEREAMALQAAEAHPNNPQAAGASLMVQGSEQGMPGQEMAAPGMTASSIPAMYQNPYALGAAPLNAYGLQAAQLQQQLLGANPFGLQQFQGFGGTDMAQQQLLSQLMGQQLMQSSNGVRPPLALYAPQTGFPAMAPQGFAAGASYGDLATQQAMLAAQAGQTNPTMAAYGAPYAQQLSAAQGQLPPGMAGNPGGGQRNEVEEDDYKQYGGRPGM